MLGRRSILVPILAGGVLAPAGAPASGGLPAPAPPAAPAVSSPSAPYVWADFDADGYTDLAIGASGEDLIGQPGAGAVNVIYGTRRGLKAKGNQFWHQGILKGGLEADDDFGTSLAAGDFDGDGYADLAVGATGEDLNGSDGAGAVNVIYGARRGLRAKGNQFWHQGRLKGGPEADDDFGSSLAAGDFDGDGYTDLAIGTPFEVLGAKDNAGAVNVVYGTRRGLRAKGNQFWHQGRLRGGLEADDDFGLSVTAGDFNSDGYADLAVGAPFEALDGNDFLGAVNVVYGTARGLSRRGNQFWHQGRLQGEAEAGDEFGQSLAAGDFDADGYAELAIGAPFEDLGGINNAGAVNVVYGTGRGLRRGGNQFWHQGKLLDTPEANDRLGWSLAAGDFDGDGQADLAIGAREEELNGNAGAGAVNVVYGTRRGLRANGNQFWHQGKLLDTPEANDRLSDSLAAGDFDGDGYADLAIGAPIEDVDANINAGAVNVVYGTRRGLRASGNQFWHQGRLIGELEANDFFGFPLA